jgi:hypothetical protein
MSRGALVLVLVAAALVGGGLFSQRQLAAARDNAASAKAWQDRAGDLHLALHWTRGQLVRARSRVVVAEREVRRSRSTISSLEQRQRDIVNARSRQKDAALWASERAQALAAAEARLRANAAQLSRCNAAIGSSLDALAAGNRGSAQASTRVASRTCAAARSALGGGRAS